MSRPRSAEEIECGRIILATLLGRHISTESALKWGDSVANALAAPPRRRQPVYQSATGWVYFLTDANGTAPVKIGHTVRPVDIRFCEHQTSHFMTLKLEVVVAGGTDLEGRLHAYCAPALIRGEWFSRSDEVLRAIDAAKTGQDALRLLLQAAEKLGV